MIAAVIRKRLKLAVIVAILCCIVIMYRRNFFSGGGSATNKERSAVEGKEAGKDSPFTKLTSRVSGAPIVDDSLRWLPLPADKKVAMRMDLPTTQHRWPWGQDKYNTKEKCEKKQYDHSKLSPASVIICFHETEQLEHLLHTVHSVIQHSPPRLLHEVILVDDNSHKVMHTRYLSNYVSSVFNGKVRIIINNGPESLGVIKARVLGVSKARAPVVITLDAHMEARAGWLEPLLYEISRDRRTLASVTLDWMKPQTDGSWIYEHGPSDAIAAWFWQRFGFSLWEQESPENTKRLETDPTQPFLNPCTIGHWAMDRSFFYEIGGLDPGMQLWGGENIDLAIRTYLWDGRVLGIPCCHVAHLEDDIQRDYRYKEGLGKKTDNNYKRIVEVWLDEYKETFYYYNPDVLHADAGNITERLQLKARCPNTFSKFMEKGYPQLGNTFGDNIARGGLKCAAYPELTMYWSNPWTYGMRRRMTLKENQEMFLTRDGYLRYDLAVYNAERDESGVVKFSSHTTFRQTGKDTRWLHKQDGLMVSVEYEKSCMQCSTDKETIEMAACDANNKQQQWSFAEYTPLYKDIKNKKVVDTDYLKKYNQHLNS